MPSVNLRQLRNTRRLKAWLQAGQTVELRERDRVLGQIVPQPTAEAPQHWPNFAARSRQIFGRRRVPGTDLLIKERDRF